jgi:hypothetical protein
MSKKWFALAGVIGLAVFLMQCEYSSTSYGEWDEMIVLGDSAQVTDLSEDIENHFTSKRDMPVTETSFNLKFMPIEKLPRFETPEKSIACWYARRRGGNQYLSR